MVRLFSYRIRRIHKRRFYLLVWIGCSIIAAGMNYLYMLDHVTTYTSSISSMNLHVDVVSIVSDGASGATNDTTSRETSNSLSSGSSSCLVHEPLQLLLSNTIMKKIHTNKTMLIQPTGDCGILYRKWRTPDPTARTTSSSSSNLVPESSSLSSLAKEIMIQQTNCNAQPAIFHVDNDYGLGSHMYLWSQSVCNAAEMGNYRIQTYNPSWLWLDETYCRSDIDRSRRNGVSLTSSPFSCYFPAMEDHCIVSPTPLNTTIEATNVTDPRNTNERCARIKTNETYLKDFRRASIEYIFHEISPLLIKEARRQSGLLFGRHGPPDDLITVHIRWGDKFWEMDLAPISEYLSAIHTILNRRHQQEDNTTKHSVRNGIHNNQTVAAHIYLATEDPHAVEEFIRAAPDHWNLYIDRSVVELSEFRPPKGNRASWTTRITRGRAGLVALGSLLVAMEATDYVLTTASNWSRIMNELRQVAIDPQCNNCTTMIDLRPGQW